MPKGDGNKGKKVYNNGIVSRYFSENDVISEEWVLGMLPRSKEKNDEINEKRKKSCLEKYGVEHTSKLDKVKKKIEETNIKRYGVKAPSQNDNIKDKAKKTNLKRYGYYSSAMSPDVKEKAARTNLKRYGYYSSAMAPEIKEKQKKTNLERYGAVSPSFNKVVKDKKKQTTLKHFNVEYPLQSEEVKQKSKETCLEKYGTEYAIQSEEVQERVIKTNIEKYGVEHASQSDIIKEKSKKIFIEKYGVDNPSKSEVIKEKRAETNRKRYGNETYFKTKDFLNKVSDTCQERYGVPWPCMIPEVREASSNDSKPNRDFAELLESKSIKYKREFHISSYSYDFKIMNKLIEIDPYPTHNSLWGLFGEDSKKDADYHQKKSRTAEVLGYQVIHIFDWDNPEKIVKNLLLSKDKVYARKLKVYNIPKDEVREFLNEYHLQGTCNGQSICLGLRDISGELMSLMTFGKPRYNKNYQYELLRYCSSKNVIGGAQKLFKHFIKEYNPESIISYCDRSKFRGDVYNKLGFILALEGKPSKHWFGMRDKRHITDNLLRQRGFDQLFNANYGKGTSNEELIIKAEYVPIYDCGQDTYTWGNK